MAIATTDSHILCISSSALYALTSCLSVAMNLYIIVSATVWAPAPKLVRVFICIARNQFKRIFQFLSFWSFLYHMLCAPFEITLWMCLNSAQCAIINWHFFSTCFDVTTITASLLTATIFCSLFIIILYFCISSNSRKLINRDIFFILFPGNHKNSAVSSNSKSFT